jgi:aryl-phospho-beta-D-glucosidase BglC (GH1 family)
MPIKRLKLDVLDQDQDVLDQDQAADGQNAGMALLPQGALSADAVGGASPDSVSSSQAVAAGPATIGPSYFSTSGNQIVDSVGHDVQIAGVNWFGMQNTNLVPDGLWAQPYKTLTIPGQNNGQPIQGMMDHMKQLGFNTIRLEYASDTLHTTATPTGFDASKNPDLVGLTPLQIMDKIVDYAGQIGMRVILDHHRSSLGGGTQDNGLWYDTGNSPDGTPRDEAHWVSDWAMLAQHYANNPTVIGADLSNEPHNGTWGSPDGVLSANGATDWVRASELAGNAILAANPNWLIFDEGVGSYKGQSYWWGGNLLGVRDLQVQLNVANRLVYSVHDYGDSINAQPWFFAPNYPANLPGVFNQYWGYIYQGFTPTGGNTTYTAPIWVGEFGSALGDEANGNPTVLDPKDPPWLTALTHYMGGDTNNDGVRDIPVGQKGPSWTYFAWNDNSQDTGGIVQSDWTTVNQNKMAYLTPIESPFPLPQIPRSDFNADGVSDILFRNDTSGDTWFAAMNAGAFQGWQQIGGSNTSYSAIGGGYFYGNGTEDILFRNNSTGDTWFEGINSGTFTGWQQIGGSDTHYAVVGVGDFFGHKPDDDILYRNSSTGDTWFEEISNGAFAGWHQIGGSDTTYAAVGIGDFFGNGTDDILFRNISTGDTWFEAISNAGFNGWHQIGGSDTRYAVAGVGNFYGNGTEDILFRNNSTGDTWIEAISNGSFKSWSQVGSSDTHYAVVAVGDYIGNGTDDVLFRNNGTGDTWIAAISNGSFNGWNQVGGSNPSYTVKT